MGIAKIRPHYVPLCRTICIAMPSKRNCESKEQEKKRFFDLADQLERAQVPDECKRIKETLVRMMFGEQKADPRASA
jgi:hypothetical protein